MTKDIYKLGETSGPERIDLSWVKNIPRFNFESDFHVCELVWIYGQMGLPNTYLYNTLIENFVPREHQGKINPAILRATEIVDHINGDWDEAYTRVNQLQSAILDNSPELINNITREQHAILYRLFGPNTDPSEPVIYLDHFAVCGMPEQNRNLEKEANELISKIDPQKINPNIPLYSLTHLENGENIINKLVQEIEAEPEIQEYAKNMLIRALILSKIALKRNLGLVGLTWSTILKNKSSLYIEPRSLLDRYFEPLRLICSK